MLRYLLLAGLVVGCAAPVQRAPRLVVSPSIAEPALAAVELWERASGGEYSPEVVVSEECDEGPGTWCIVGTVQLAGCGDAVDPYGCTHGASWVVFDLVGAGAFGVSEISTGSTPPAWLVSTVAHEIGHQLGAEHAAGTLMDPLRSEGVRARPCVDALTLAAAGLGGVGACVEEF